MSQNGRRGITINVLSRDPIPVTVRDRETDEEIHFNIRPSAALTMRERKLLGTYLRAIGDFEAMDPDDIDAEDYIAAEDLRIKTLQIGTEGLDMGFVRRLSPPDQMTLCLALDHAFAEEQRAVRSVTTQAEEVMQSQDERPGNAFRKATVLRTSSERGPSPPTISAVEESQDG